MALTYRIHPSIGIARLGNAAPESHFIAPEIPGCPSELYVKSFRKDGAIRPQGARFRIFAYDGKKCGGEVKLGADVKEIEWTVHLANKKAYWFKFNGRSGETSPDIDPADVIPYNTKERRNRSVHPDDVRRRKLIIDPQPRSILATGKKMSMPIRKRNSPRHADETWPGPFKQGRQIVQLGTLFVDSSGLLTIVGGAGHSGSTLAANIGSFANNDGWFDDVSDGPVQAILHLRDGSKVMAATAWVIVGPPRFAPAIKPLVTMFDAIYDVAVRHHGYNSELFDPWKGEYRNSYRPSFAKEIYPILRAAELVQWTLAFVNHIPLGSHHHWNYEELASGEPTAGRKTPGAIFAWLRKVEDWNNPATSHQMPRLHGDNAEDVSFLTLTRTQMYLMKLWSRGQFLSDWSGPVKPLSPHSAITPDGLDRAALENCIGGAFYPGIEAGWILRDPRIYWPDDPLRIRALVNGQEHEVYGLTPGSATMRSAVPWQADFYECVRQWWPSHRPTNVQTSARSGAPRDDWASGVQDKDDMVRKWSELGFVVGENQAGEPPFVERQRTLKRQH